MFSQNIQNLIDTGGQEAAAQRIAQINSRVNAINQSVLSPNAEQTVKPFAEILKSSNAVDSKFKIMNPDKIQSIPDSTTFVSYQTPVDNNGKVSKHQILNIISKISEKYDIDEKLVQAVVRQESGFNPKATSHCGAMGLMQLMPATAKGLGVTDPYDPIQNIDGGVRYLKSKMQQYNGNLILALAAYNAGSGNVAKYGGVPPFKETQNYVKSILSSYLG